MNHPIAQVVALTCHANASLRERAVPRFFPGNSTTTFCDSITFVNVSKTLLGGPREEPLAAAPDAWFAYLRAAGISAIYLSRTPRNDPRSSDRLSAAFVGGAGTWAMEAVHPNQTRAIWLARWEVWNHSAPEHRIWRVRYGRVLEVRAPSPPVTDLEASAARLRAALADAHEFSKRHQCVAFTERFLQALETLDSDGARRYGFHKDLAPDGSVPPPAPWLLDACQSAWVFGGMGAWNDLAFSGDAQAEYERISERLFLTVSDAIQAAANASCAAGGRSGISGQAAPP